ncbi:hypothetical protein DSL72_000284 [Monilinia vaccinii-corymbosi]|uniref:Uncharacterized protein n=1 Tax=Monilinia vaccinii-corymbosi TaxID=61207 RepID=A0A8A3P5J9_9HELO|nr:hypothetical protein DSL72_000284 [Monilinia vaccinii-corymbosi]
MDKIKAIFHGTTPQHEKEVKEEKKAEKAEEKELKKAEKIEEKEEKKAEKHGPHSGEGSHIGNTSHSTTHPTTGATHTSNATTNVNPAGVSQASGGLGQNTIKSDYNSIPTDGPLTTHGRHAEREAAIGSDGVNVPHRPRDSEFGSTATGTAASGLGGVGNGSRVTGSNTHVHGVDSATRTSEAGLAGQNARDHLSSYNGGVASNTTSGLGGVTSIPSGHELDTHGGDKVGSHGTSHHGRDAALGSGAVGAAGLAEHEHRKHGNTGLGSNNQTHGHHEGSHGTHNSATLNAADPMVDSDLDGNRLPNKTPSGYGTKDAYSTTTGSSGHHLGRDAAAVGAAGAVGEGINHHNNQHNQGALEGSNGPHQTFTANLLDPHLNSSGVSTEDAHTHHGHGGRSGGRVEGGGAEEADGVHGAKGTSAGAGVVPIGTYEAGYGHNTTAGPHSSNLANKADPRVDSDLSKQQNHHYGRDATLVGGAGAAAYEADKHHHNSNNTEHPTHNSATGPDHIFTGPVMDDPAANSDLREGKIDQHEHRQGVTGVARDHDEDHSYSTGGGHEHSKSRGLESEINSAPLGNTSTTPGSGLRDNIYNTSSGSTGLKHNNLTGNDTSAGTTGSNHGSGHNTTSAGLDRGSGLAGSTGTHGLSGENRLGETSEFGNANTNSRVLQSKQASERASE